ncbi:MAG: hypothetical protein DHS20C18_25820 [Saprospiraceae bacterium]|nr:MAG: hypothetical protein DHS20C18_25820 [Saprospiraceae bacterium]
MMMKTLSYLLLFLLYSSYFLQAQSAEAILQQYTETTGGQAQWDQVVSMKVTGIAKLLGQGGMELPYTRIMQKDGKQFTALKVNGMNYVDTGFDGNIVWGTNTQMQLAEKDQDALENAKLAVYDFPYPGHNWQQNGYQAKYLGEVMVGDFKTHKIELTKRPQWVNGEEMENIVFLYIDVEKNVPILRESEVLSGPNKGEIMKSYLSDYRNVAGYWYPFVVTMKYGDQTFQILETETVEWNAEIDASVFSMPEK